MFFQKQKNNFHQVLKSAVSLFSTLKNGKFFRLSVLFLALFSFACSDQGCIEADDFGEYDTQTLEILSNSSADNCVYDYSKTMTDTSQGSGIKTCLISGSVTIYDENDVSQVSSTGCNGLPGIKFKNLCVDQCVANCNANVGSTLSETPEPSWIATTKKIDGRNGGVTLSADSEISIRAIGNVNLGDKFDYAPFFVSADDFFAQSKKVDWSPQVLDVGQGKSLNVYFSGKFIDGSFMNGGNTPVNQVGAGNSSVIDEKIYNAARRLVAYVIDHPTGYDFNSAETNEKIGSRGVPLMPDANLWQCNYTPTGSNLETQSACSNKSYVGNGYINVDDASVNNVFPITSDTKSEGLGIYGGMVRWAGDGLIKDIFDPFANANVNCDDPACTGAINNAQGRIVGDISAVDVNITAQVSAKVSLKFLISGTSCNGTYDVYVKDSSNNNLYSYEALSINSTSWINSKLNAQNNAVPMHIAIEKNQILVIKQNAATYNTINGNAVSCGRALAVKFAPYHDIEIKKSGIVSLAMLNGAGPSGCVIKGRIINPTGSHSDTNTNSDFYEYANFNQPTTNGAAHDPFEQLAVPATTLLSSFDNATSSMAKIFVRKGQKIRFSPESWDGTWNATGGARDCGIGMAMRIIPRPALLCRGYAEDNVLNPECTLKFNSSGSIIGCDEVAPECSDSGSSSYCPNPQCIKPITCAEGNANNFYTRTACTFGAIPATDSATACNQSSAGYTLGSCNSCSDARFNKAQTPAYLSKSNMVQCYDLENYTGKVDNIPNNGGSGSVATFFANASTSKGATILTSFGGSYGNFKDFVNSGKVDATNSNNVIFQVAQPLNLSKDGRLKFLLLDGDNFLNINDDYSNNTGRGSGYNGVNGFKIDASSQLEFTNGEWLEAILCKETSDTSVLCRSDVVPTQIASQSPVVRLADPVPGSFNPQTTTAFKIDSYGSLIRFQPRTNVDCESALVGDNYYCHKDTVNEELIKLSFKIKDPEPANCNTSDPTSTSGFNGIKITNSQYRPSECNTADPNNSNPPVKNGIFSSIESPAGSGTFVRTCVAANNAGLFCDTNDTPVCTKQFRCVNKYANNSGKYYVTIRVKKQGSNISEIVNDVITPVIEVMDGSKDGTKIGQAERIYKLIIGDPRYQALLSMSLILMYSFYGVGYLMGVTEAGLKDMIMKVVKISLIYFFVSPQGWEWFDTFAVKLFKNGTDYLAFLMASSFDDSPALQNAIHNYDFYDKSVLFSSVDKVFGIFFSQTVQKKISALLFASIFGWAYLLIIYYGILLYIYAVANAVLLYLTSQVFISVLFVLGPIFFIFTLFNQTKEMFDKWLTQLIGFSLQQIFLLTTLAFFNMMMYEVIKLALGYKICWDEVWTINIIIRITLMSFWTIASLPPRTSAQTDAGNIGNPEGIPSLFSILFIWVIAGLMLQFITFMTDLAQAIAGGLKVSDLGAGVAGTVKAIKASAGKKFDKMWKDHEGFGTQRLDQLLFDSGDRADKVRDEKKRKIAADYTNRKALTQAGNAAMSDYKKKNSAKLANAPKEEQEKLLREAKDKAIAAKGEKLGLSEADIKRLKADSGLKYVGENVFGLTYKAAKQQLVKGGALLTSIDKKEINRGFSSKEANSALKNKNNDSVGRAQFMEGLKKGNITLGKSKSDDLKLSDKLGLSKDHSDAVKQLRAEGQISKMAFGTGWALDSVAKTKIDERIKKNKAEKNAAKPQFASAKDIASLEVKARYQENLLDDKASADGTVRDRNSLVARAFGRRAIKSTGKERSKLANNIARDRGKRIADSVDSQLTSVQAKKKEASDKYDVLRGKADNLTGANDPSSNTFKHFKEMHEHATSGEPDRIKIARNDADYMDRTNKLKAVYSEMAQNQTTQANLGEQESKLIQSKTTLAEAKDVALAAEWSGNSEVTNQYNSIMNNYGDNSISQLDNLVKNNPLSPQEKEELGKDK